MQNESEFMRGQRLQAMPAEFETIFKSVNDRLDDFDRLQHEKSKNKARQGQTQIIQNRILKTIGATEENTAQRFHDVESISNWMNILHVEQETIQQPTNDEDDRTANENAVLMSYRGNTVELKTLETEVQQLLRNMIDTKETPLTIRLQKILSNAKDNLSTRQDMLKRIQKSIEKQDSIIQNSTDESANLNKEYDKYSNILSEYKSKDNYGTIQKAKKIKYMQNEWQEKKGKMMKQITEMKEEIEDYMTLESANQSLARQNMKNVDELAKLQNQYDEIIRNLDEESSVENSRNQQMLQQIQKELGSYRNTTLQREKKRTGADLSKQKSSFDRLMNKIKKQVGTMKKQAEKALKSSNKEGPSIEQCSEVLETEHEKDMNYWGEMFHNQEQEFQGILDSHVSNLTEEKNRNVQRIVMDNENKMLILQSKRDRLNVFNNEREIEVSSINERVDALESLVNDFQEQYETREKEIEDMQNGLLEQHGEAKSEAERLRRNTRKLQSFI